MPTLKIHASKRFQLKFLYYQNIHIHYAWLKHTCIHIRLTFEIYSAYFFYSHNLFLSSIFINWPKKWFQLNVICYWMYMTHSQVTEIFLILVRFHFMRFNSVNFEAFELRRNVFFSFGFDAKIEWDLKSRNYVQSDRWHTHTYTTGFLLCERIRLILLNYVYAKTYCCELIKCPHLGKSCIRNA